MTQFNEIQTIKRRFFALRNGVIADTLRRGGSPFKIIFGLNVPQIKEIAAETGFRSDLASQLWANTTTRESMLLAPMLIDPKNMTYDDARRMIGDVPCVEVADILCHGLLRKCADAYGWAKRLAEEDSDMHRYAAMRLLWHHLSEHGAEIRLIAEREVARDNALTVQPASQIIEELKWL